MIYAPNYSAGSAGIRAIYMLGLELLARGYQVMVCGPNGEDWQTGFKKHSFPKQLKRITVLNFKDARDIVRWSDPIVVYPETIMGNPLSASRVVRWILNSPGLLGGAPVYPESELIFVYSDVYRPHVKNQVAGKMYVPTIDHEIFHRPDDESAGRSLECYYVGKSTFKEGIFDSDKVFEITRMSPKRSELGKLFRGSRVLYCFDNSSIICYEAIACGCPTVIIPDGTHAREDFSQLELGLDGLAWGMDDLPRARATVGNFGARYAALEGNLAEAVNNFVATTQSHRYLALTKYPGAPEALLYELRTAEAEIDRLQGVLHKYEGSLYLKLRATIARYSGLEIFIQRLASIFKPKRNRPRWN